MKMIQPPTAIATTLLVSLIALTVACGYSAKMPAPVAGTLPTIATLNPGSATAGAPAFTLTVNGANFSTKATVNWNGAVQTANTTFVSATQLTVALPASAIAAAGTVTVTVTNPGTSGTGIYGTGATLPETSTPMDFAVN